MRHPAYFLLVIISLMVFLVGIPGSWALESVARPSCDDGSVGSCVDGVLDEQSGMMDEIDGMIDDMASMGLFSLARTRMDLGIHGREVQEDLREKMANIRRSHDRAREANGATSDEEYDDMLAQGDKNSGKRCKNSDITFYNSLADDNYLPPDLSETGPKFGNNKCDVFNALDLDGNSVKINERKENMCEQVCEEKPNQRGKTKERFIGGMQDAGTTAHNMRLALSSQRANMAGLEGLIAELRLSGTGFPSSLADNDDPCSDESNGPGDDLIAEAVLQGVITGINVAVTLGDILTEVLATAADLADDSCKQDAAGFNASVACVPFVFAQHISSGIFGILSGVSTTLGDAKDIVSIAANIAQSYEEDLAKACGKITRDNTITLMDDMAGLKDDTRDLKKAAGDTNAALTRVEEEVALLKILINQNQGLLLTPQGKRDEFPLR